MSQGRAPTAEHPLPAAVRVVRAELAGGCDVGAWSLSDEDILCVLDEIVAAEARLAALRLAVVAEVDGRDLGVAEATTTAGLLRGRLLMHPSTTKRTVRLATGVHSECVATGAALARAACSEEQARVITHAITHLPPVDADIKLAAERFLIDQSAVLDPLLLRRAAEALTETLATQPDRDERILRDVAGREFTGVVAADGMVRIHGWLDREAWAQFTAVLDPLAAPAPAADGTLDPRRAARRRGDALPELARLAAAAQGRTGPPPTLTVTIDFESLSGQLARMGRLNTGEPITAAAARRIGCDSQLIPTVLGTAGQPLDVGRAARIVPPSMRRALIVRDVACAFPGCDRPAAWSEAHHIRHWADGGHTALHNLALLCGPHHIAVHHHGWQVSLDSNGLPTFHPPPWIDPERKPRQHHRYQLRQSSLNPIGNDPPHPTPPIPT